MPETCLEGKKSVETWSPQWSLVLVGCERNFQFGQNRLSWQWDRATFGVGENPGVELRPNCGKFRRAVSGNFSGKAGRADVSGNFPEEAGQAAAVSGNFPEEAGQAAAVSENFRSAVIDNFRRDEKLRVEIRSTSCS
ncbi:hypothetical protein Nepgr_030791 [Nepenthes gracilis]|uniref:Uncharacterized protein n=1 Tax=Nepenthes gracilis TaxID=150966 RepID=A0AAD3Y4K4_NEPGR|nr:hypothetical protein Nepgr_030791 [Nepenthes gracilis]